MPSIRLRHVLVVLIGAFFALTSAAALAGEPKSPNFGSRTDNRDGSSAMTVGRTLPTGWESKVGLDVALAAPQDPLSLSQPFDGPRSGPSTGSAWANMTMPGLASPFGWDKTVVEARLDPLNDKGRLGATLSRSLPLGHGLGLTLESSLALVQALDAPAAGTAAQQFEGSRLVRFKVGPTATTFSAGQVFSSADDRWLNTLGAEQKLFGGPVSISGSLTETTAGGASTAITAAFSRKL